MELDQIISRIKKLMKHAESAKNLGSLAEAEIFTAKVNELLLEYNITMHQIAMSADKDEDEFSKYVYNEKISYANNQSGDRWRLNLIKTLTYYNMCNFHLSHDKTFRVYGRMENVDVVVWMYNFLSIGLHNLSLTTYNSLPSHHKHPNIRYAYLKNFLLGCADGIAIKLSEQRKSREVEMTGMILYNKQALERYEKENIPNLRFVKSKPVKLGHGYNEGVEAGKAYNITNPIASAKVVKPLTNGRLIG